mgnify:CR=1 FL=1
MNIKLIPAAVKTFLVCFACIAVFGFSGKNSPSRLTETQFHDHVASIINGTGMTQEDIASMMTEAEQRKTEGETASGYVENYMNTHFKAATSNSLFAENRVSIASPGQPDLRMSAACNQTALQTITTGAIGYYYAYATKCDGTYKYDAENYTGGSVVYVRAEAGPNILEAFILF